MTAETTAPDPAELHARLAALEAENARLRAGDTLALAEAPRRASASRWRAFFSALCIVIASILVPLSIVTAWARLELVDESAFVATLAPLADDPAVQQMVIDETVEAVESQIDFQQLTANVFDGISQLGLPPRATQALELLQAPAAQGLSSLLTQTVTRVVESDAFADTWTATTRAAHRALTTAATSGGGGVVVINDEGLGIQLGAIVERVKENLIDRGIGIAQLIPAVDKVVIIGTGDTLVTIRTVYALATTLGWWLPVLTLALFALGIAIARRRSTAVLGTGIGFALGGGALALAFAIGQPLVGQAAGQLGVSVTAADVVYASLVGSMQQTAAVAMLLGVVIAVLGWFASRWSPAVRARGAIGALNSSLRRQFAQHGFDTGRVGAWLYRYRVLVRTVVVVLAVLWLFALRPLSAGDVFLVLIVALVVVWILELLQERPGESEAAGAIVRETEAQAEAEAEAEAIGFAEGAAFAESAAFAEGAALANPPDDAATDAAADAPASAEAPVAPRKPRPKR